ncbi:MAG: hypothetical protein IJA33_05365 [Oscillospiraceae bacterium]|nr:hypothetical protein [Oscillospiraceae bacterium]
MRNITIEHHNSHNFIVLLDGVPAELSYRNFGGRGVVEALGKDGLVQLINEAEQTLIAQDFSAGCQRIFQTIGVSNAMEILRVCCGDAFLSYWNALLFRRKALGQGHSFRSMLKLVTGTKATLAQSDSPFVEELRTLCKEVQRGTLEMPTSALTNEEVCDESIRVSFLFQDNNSLVFAVNGTDVSLCTRKISALKTPADVLRAAQAIRESVLSHGELMPHITRWGGSFVFRVLYAVCPQETVDYFRDYAQKQLESRIPLDPRKALKELGFPFNDRYLTPFCHELLSALEQHKAITETILAAGNLHAIRSFSDKWLLYFPKNLTIHYRQLNFETISHPALRKEAAQFLQSFVSAAGEVDVQQIARYFYLLRSGLNALAATPVDSIKEVSLPHVRLIKSRLDCTFDRSANHISEVLQALGRMYHWASPQCAADKNPFWCISIPNKGAFLQTTDPANSVALALTAEHIDELPDYVQIAHQLFLVTSARAYDVFHVRVSELEFSEDGAGYLHFQSSKNSRRMRFQLPAPLVAQLKEYIKKTAALRERSGEDYLLLYEPTGRRSDSACKPVLLSYATYNYYINKLIARYAPALSLTTRSIRAEVGRRYHSEGLSSSQVAIALGNTPAVAKRHYRTLSPRDEAELHHRRYATFFAVPPTSEATTPHPMWGSCDSTSCLHRGNCHACPYLHTTEVSPYVPSSKSS